MTIIEIIKDLTQVERVAAWQDRHYITLAAVRSSHAKADRLTKIWTKGDVLTIETGKGYHSDAYIAEKYALIEAVKAAGGSVREI